VKNWFRHSEAELPFVIVKSRPYEHFQREAIRQTYGTHFRNRLIFLLGRRPDHPTTETSIELESETYGDILQGDFLDTYFNLGQKSYAALHWMNKFCSKERFYFLVRTVLLSENDSIFRTVLLNERFYFLLNLVYTAL